MDAAGVVLGIVSAAGGEVEGRTYLQKVAYFVSTLLGVPLGFRPHYYGPYSRAITAETDAQVSIGNLTEERISFGMRAASGPQFDQVRYTYRLTPQGEEHVGAVASLNGSEFASLRQVVERIRATGADYLQLSCAAKLYYLLDEAGGTISREKAKEEAGLLRWEITDHDIDTAVSVLQQLELVQS